MCLHKQLGMICHPVGTSFAFCWLEAFDPSYANSCCRPGYFIGSFSTYAM
ncbi:capsid protein 1 [Galliform chaphamaparvovirus 15]|nr:capsid protein 1 [Galliform chaphamaparvovirus 15]